MMPTVYPRRRINTASWLVTMLLPTPPLPDTIPYTWRTVASGWCSLSSDWGDVREAQLSPQVEQLWVQFSMVSLISGSPYIS